MKAKNTGAEELQEEVPGLGFSQVTPHEKSLRKSKICAGKSVLSVVDAGEHEPLIRKPKMQCVAEKTSVSLGSIPAHLEAIQRLTKMELRARYKSEATAHRNMKGRAKSKGAVIHPEFHKFEDFLRHLGPCPANRATVDRINNSDPEYAPGKVRWADKRTQNGNKGDTLVFYYSRTGDTYTVSRLAKLQNTNANTIRTRYHRGWKDDEIIEGQRGLRPAPQPLIGPPKTYFGSKKSSEVGREKSTAQITFEETAQDVRRMREIEGGEYFLATPKEIGEITPEFCDRAWVRRAWPIFMKLHLPEWWRKYKPHIRFDDLKPFQQRLIRQVDPTYRRVKPSK